MEMNDQDISNECRKRIVQLGNLRKYLINRFPLLSDNDQLNTKSMMLQSETQLYQIYNESLIRNINKQKTPYLLDVDFSFLEIDSFIEKSFNI